MNGAQGQGPQRVFILESICKLGALLSAVIRQELCKMEQFAMCFYCVNIYKYSYIQR